MDEKIHIEYTEVKAKLVGTGDIMFDRFIDYSKEKRPPDQKLYLMKDNILVLPQSNIVSFLFNESNPAGCAKTFEGKTGKEYIRIGQGHVFIKEAVIPFTASGKQVIFNGFNGQFWVNTEVPRVKKGALSIKAESKERPVLRVPWELEFTISILKNGYIDETKLYNWFVKGGLQIALGTYRPRYGRFYVDTWEKIDK